MSIGLIKWPRCKIGPSRDLFLIPGFTAPCKKLETFEPRPGIAYLLITCATFLWGLSIVIGRGVHQEIPPRPLFLAVVCRGCFPFTICMCRTITQSENHSAPRNSSFSWDYQIGSSVMLMVGVNFTTAINASVINAVQPAVTAVAAWILTKDKITQDKRGHRVELRWDPSDCCQGRYIFAAWSQCEYR